MKTLKWFRVGEPIPTRGVYITSSTKTIGYEFVEAGHLSTEVPVKEEQHLYEIPIKSAKKDGE